MLNNSIFKARTKGIGIVSKEEAIAWGGTGPFLRGSGVDWDLRKKKPYGGYDKFEFDVPARRPTGTPRTGSMVHTEEIRQSLRIMEQCLKNMPGR